MEAASGDIQLTSAKNYLKEFAKRQHMDFIKEELAAEEKILRELKQDLGAWRTVKPVPRGRPGTTGTP